MTYGDFTDIEFDNTEVNPNIIEYFEFDFEYTMIKRNLPLFDYIQYNNSQRTNAGIERKSISDFISSYKSDHMWDQCNRMVSQDEFIPYIIIHGTSNNIKLDIEEYYEKLSKAKKKIIKPDYNGFWGAVGSIMSRYNIPVLVVPTEFRFSFVSAKIFNSHRLGKAGQLRKVKITATTKYSVPAKILALVPGIDQKAVDIVKKLSIDYPIEIFDLTVKKLITVDKIGKKKALSIIEYFGI